jgi:membrane protein
VIERFVRDRGLRVAGALSFTTLLALVPLTAVSIAMLSVFPVFEDWVAAAQKFAYANLVPASGEVVSRYLQQFAANAARLTIWGLAFLFVTALMLMATIEDAFNDIWHAETRRKPLHRLLAYWAILTLAPLLFGLSLSITSYLMSLPLLAHGPALGGVRSFLLRAAPVAFEATAFVLLYTIVPNRRVRLRHALAGALLATVLFEAAKRGFGWFVLSFTSYRKVYGAIAALPLFLVWIYASWVVTLIGAVVTAALPERATARGVRRTRSGTGSARRPR